MIAKTALALGSTILLAGAASGEEEPLLDYRDNAFLTGSPFYSEADRRQLKAALEKGPDGLADEMGKEFALLGDADGAFTAPGAEERAYLVQESAPVAIDPFPQGAAPVLVVMRGEEAAGFFRLPAEIQYQRLVAAADGDGDGRDEVLLESSFMNMGQSSTTLDVVELSDDGTAEPVEKLEEVRYEGCDSPVGERSRSASTIYVGADGFRAEKHELECPE